MVRVIFASSRTGKKIEPAPGFEMDPAQQLDIVEVAGDRETAAHRGVFSVVLERRPDGWKVIHDHTSAEPKP